MSFSRASPGILAPLRPRVRPRPPRSAGLLAPPAPARPFSSAVPLLPDLLLAYPYPSAIVALTLALRLTTTVPATIWQRARMRRARERVAPEMKRWRDVLMVQVAGESRRRGLGYDDYRKELKRQLADRQAALHKEHGTHPTLTMVAPLAVHIPLVLLVSLSVRAALEAPDSALAAAPWLVPGWLEALGMPSLFESLTGTSAAAATLALPDPSGAIPVLGGLGLFGAAELLGRRTKRLAEAAAAGSEPGGEVVVENPATMASAAQRPGVAQRRRLSTSAGVAAAAPRPGQAAAGRPGAARRTAAPVRLPASASPSPPPAPPAAPASPAAASRPAPPPPVRASLRTAPPPPAATRPSPDAAEPQVVYVSRAERLSAISTNSMRCGGVLFIPFALTVPAGLSLYWTTSIIFTFFQNLVLDIIDQRAADKAKLVAASAAADRRA